VRASSSSYLAIGPPHDRNVGMTVLIVEDHAVFRESLAHALARGGTAVQMCGSSNEAFAIVERGGIDVVLGDYDLGSETILPLLERMAAAGIQNPVLLLTSGVTMMQLRQIHSRGIAGILLKDRSLEEVIAAIHTIAAGGKNLVDPRLMLLLVQADSSSKSITERERDVLKGVLDGLSSKELAARSFLSESTVKNTLQVLFRRFGVRTRAQLVRVALEVLGSDIEADTIGIEPGRRKRGCT
jgi:two-component system, NarL family, nitrate/nitrite response regulator NarL